MGSLIYREIISQLTKRLDELDADYNPLTHREVRRLLFDDLLSTRKRPGARVCVGIYEFMEYVARYEEIKEKYRGLPTFREDLE